VAILSGSDRAFESTDWKVLDEVFQARICEEEFFCNRCETLSECGDLGWDIVGAANDGQGLIFRAFLGQARKERDWFSLNEFEGGDNLESFDVFGEVTAGHRNVNVLVTCKSVELFDARLHIMAYFFLALINTC